MLKHGFEFSHRADPFAARKLVDFRCDDGAPFDAPCQPFPSDAIVLEARVPGVDHEQRGGRSAEASR